MSCSRCCCRCCCSCCCFRVSLNLRCLLHYTHTHAQLRRGGTRKKNTHKAVNLKYPMQLQFSTAADCPPRYPFRFTTRNTLSRAHERRLPEPPKKQEETGSLSLSYALVCSLSRACSLQSRVPLQTGRASCARSPQIESTTRRERERER